MNIIIQPGNVPANSKLKTFEEYFQSRLIDPSKILFADDFIAGSSAASVAGRPLTKGPAGVGTLNWAELTSTTAVDVTGGFLTAAGTGTRLTRADGGTSDGQVYARVLNGGGTAVPYGVGVAFRIQDATNYLRAVVFSDPGNLRVKLQQVVANVVTDLVSAPFSTVVGMEYDLRVIYSGTSVMVYLNGGLIIDTTTTQFQTQKGGGTYFAGAINLHRIFSFALGTI